MIRITPTISLADEEVALTFVRSSGPGGQNVNKVSTAVELRFDVAGSTSLPAEVAQRLCRQQAGRITSQGVLLIDARRHRTQKQNRQDAIDHLVEMIARAAVRPRPRHRTAPTAGSRRRRLESKRIRGQTKRLRGPVEGE